MRTFAGADHLQHHLCSPAVVQAGLLVEKPLLLHLLILEGQRRGALTPPSEAALPPTLTLLHTHTHIHTHTHTHTHTQL